MSAIIRACRTCRRPIGRPPPCRPAAPAPGHLGRARPDRVSRPCGRRRRSRSARSPPECDGVVLRSTPVHELGQDGDPVQGDPGRRRGQGVRQQLEDHLRGLHHDRQQLVQDHRRERQGRPQPVRPERRLRRVQPVQEAVLRCLQKTACDGVNVRSSAVDERLQEGEPVRGHEGHRDRVRLRQQLERDLRRRRRLGVVLVQDQPGQRQEPSSLYGVSAIYGAKGLFTSISSDTPASNPTPHAEPRPPRRAPASPTPTPCRPRAPTSKASTSATGRRPSTG